MKVICTFFLTSDKQIGVKTDNEIIGTGPIAVLELTTAKTGKTRKLVVCKQQTFQLDVGDQIKCLSGRTLVLVNPNTPAGFYYLSERAEKTSTRNWQIILTLNEETVRGVSRGRAAFFEGMGNDTQGVGGLTR